jgi:hypothetical protein
MINIQLFGELKYRVSSTHVSRDSLYSNSVNEHCAFFTTKLSTTRFAVTFCAAIVLLIVLYFVQGYLWIIFRSKNTWHWLYIAKTLKKSSLRGCAKLSVCIRNWLHKSVCVRQRIHDQMRLKYELDRILVCAVHFSLYISNQFCHYWPIVQTGRTCDMRHVICWCNVKILSRAVTVQAHGRSNWSGRRCQGERQARERRSTCAPLPLYSNGNRVCWLPAKFSLIPSVDKVHRVCCLPAYFTLNLFVHRACLQPAYFAMWHSGSDSGTAWTWWLLYFLVIWCNMALF